MASVSRMNAFIRVRDLRKTFVLAEKGGGPTPLWHALTAGKRETLYRQIEALANITFEVKQGERVGVIGRNGAGKTTLLSIMAGVAEATSGSVEINGDVHAMLTIGAVLRDEATGRENIFIDGAVHGKARDEIAARAEEMIAFADIGEFIDRPVRTYSSGMKARLAFAMGAFIEPDILIIDETLAVGDAFFARKALQRMKEIARQGRIVFMVSHALASIVEMCSRCIWLDEGRLVMDGDPVEVTAAYQASVRQADEVELRRKFDAGETVVPRPAAGRVAAIAVEQMDKTCAATVRAFLALTINVSGIVGSVVGAANLEFAITRVDGRRIWNAIFSTASGMQLPDSGAFTVSLTFDPFLLGADLYSLDVRLVDAAGTVDVRRRVFEVIDEEGQHGGRPLLYQAPLIRVRALLESAQ
jgi:lipopolysaccharide transport system ATP-binding protein